MSNFDSSSNISPFNLLLKIALIVLIVEAIIMLGFQLLPFSLAPTVEIFTDVGLLTVLTAPMIFIVAIRPYVERWDASVAELKKSEHALRESEERFKALVNYTPNKLRIKDTEGRYTLINRKSEKLFGVTSEEAIGKKTSDIFPSKKSKNFEDHDHAVIETGEPIEAEEEFILDDEVRTYLTVKFPILDADGEIVAVGASGVDITERKKMEEEKDALQLELQQSSKLEAVGQLAGGIAHEINTPTQFVISNLLFLQDSFDDITEVNAANQKLIEAARAANVLQTEVSAAEKAAEAADLDFLKDELNEAISDSIRGMEQVASIVLSMKEFSHPSSKTKTPVDINKALETTINVSRNEWRYVAELDMDFDPELPIANCLPGELNQVFLNIIVNAAHAIESANDKVVGELGRITVGTRHDGDWLEIRISDSGSGIPDDIKGQIFDPFFTTKGVGKGTGQGLNISFDIIVNKHNGKISFDSEEGEGTTFLIRLPLNDDAERVEEKACI